VPEIPDRPITSLVFPKSGAPWLKLDRLATDQKELELKIAHRFVSALSEVAEENYLCKGPAPEPGDVLLQEGGGSEIYLQMGQVVDHHRSITTSLRERYASLIWTPNPDLCRLYRGVQVALIDCGAARDLPSPSSRDSIAVLDELSSLLYSLVRVVDSLPTNEEGQLRGKETYVDISSVPMRLHVRLLRYAPPVKEHPVKWLWTGTHQIRDGDYLERFTQVLEDKSMCYGSIDSPFWLLVYSIDLYCARKEQIPLVNLLMESDHPFERVYLFFPRTTGGELTELFPSPPEQPQPQSTESKKLLARFLPQDAIPRFDDPRWRTLPSHPQYLT
jgi:hypothetical protein